LQKHSTTPSGFGHIPTEWFGDVKLPVAYQAVPREWITYPGVEVFIAPVLDSIVGMEVEQAIFGRELVGHRLPNPENQGGSIAVVTWRNEEYPVVRRSLGIWEGPKQTQKTVQ
jgi:hypothetical protein